MQRQGDTKRFVYSTNSRSRSILSSASRGLDFDLLDKNEQKEVLPQSGAPESYLDIPMHNFHYPIAVLQNSIEHGDLRLRMAIIPVHTGRHLDAHSLIIHELCLCLNIIHHPRRCHVRLLQNASRHRSQVHGQSQPTVRAIYH